jgi:hypothetical protein
LTLALPGCAPPEQRIDGFLTFGCGDQYVQQVGVRETWFVNMSASELKNIEIAGTAWTTVHAVLIGTVSNEPKEGFFGQHAKQLNVVRIEILPPVEWGESTKVAHVSRRYRGIVVMGPESYGFVPFDRKDEMWQVVPGKVGWKELNAPFPAQPATFHNAVLYDGLVEIVGRVGPPGVYNSSSDAIREIAVDEFKYLRPATSADTTGTAVFDGVTAAIERCERPAN